MYAIKRFKELERKQDQEAARIKAYRRRAVGDPLVPTTDRSSVEKRGVLKLYHNKSGDACLATATIIGPEGTFTQGFFSDPAGEKGKPGHAERAFEYLRHHNVALVGIDEGVEFVLNAFCDCCGNLRDADPEGVDFSKE